MKILCAYSSLEFSCDHFPGVLHNREACHPIFHLPQRKLLVYLSKWASSELTPTDSYLLYLALLKSSDLVDFRVPAVRTPFTASIIAQNMEALAKTVIKLNTVSVPGRIFPSFVITPDTKSLSNTSFWIDAWKSAYSDFQAGKARDLDGRDEWKKLASREAALERLIKNPHKPVKEYARQIADWAAIAGSFSSTMISSPTSDKIIPSVEYWKDVIVKCAHEMQLYSIPSIHLEDLLDYCETNIPIGSIYSNALFKILRNALEKQRNFLGLGDKDIGRALNGGFTILDSSDDTESANMQAMIAAAPEELPQREQYKTQFEYLRAKLRWDMAQKAKKAGD